MAAKKGGETAARKKEAKVKRKRPGVHSKSKVSYHKGKPDWKKRYRGQGR